METKHTTESARTPEGNTGSGYEHLTLSEAAKIAPGRPSTNCMWRWCRRGVLARTGERIYLQHIRVGGKVYTSKPWLDDFGQALADADAAYFRRNEDDAVFPPTSSRPKRLQQRFEQHRRATVEQANQELEDAGL